MPLKESLAPMLCAANELVNEMSAVTWMRNKKQYLRQSMRLKISMLKGEEIFEARSFINEMSDNQKRKKNNRT